MSHRVKDKAIFALVDGRLDGAAGRALKQHLAECPECRGFHATVLAGREALAELERQPVPDVDWRKIDAGINEELEARAGERRGLSAPLLWGAVAATAAAAFLVTWGLVGDPRGRPGGGGPDPDQAPLAKTVDATLPDPGRALAPSEPLLAFVTFVAGEAHVALSRGDEWSPLGLETTLDEGVRLRTTDLGSAGIQVGAQGAGCRLEPGTEVSLAAVEDVTVRLELSRGRVTCQSDAEVQPIVVSVVDVVASARGSARYAVERQEPQVVVVELAEGTLRVARPDGNEEDLSGPGRFTVRSGEETSVDRVALDDEGASALSTPAIGLLPRRTIASLHLPAVDGVERVTVDGLEYGPLPLHLRRQPGSAHVLIYPAGGAEPIAHDVTVALGPTRVETGLLLASLPAMRTPPTERRVAPRFGTLDEGQVQRLRSIVGRNVRSCYERTLKRYPNTWGRIHVRFTVSTTGEAKGVRVTAVAGGHPSVNACVESSLAAAPFPPPRGGRVPIEQTITLSPRF